MERTRDIKLMAEKIRCLRETATELKDISGGMQTVDRNVDRLLACVTLLELNISDVLGIID